MSSAAKTSVKLAHLKMRKALLVAGVRIMGLWTAPAVSVPAELRKILFIRIDRIGDMVLSTPALRAIKHAFPGAHLTVLASRANAPLLHHDPHVDRVIVWDHESQGISPIGFLRQAVRLSKTGYDAVIDPMTGDDLRTALLACLSRAPLRIGYPGYGREVFFNRLCRFGADRHIADLVLETARNLGAEPVERSPHIRLLPGECDWARSWLTECGLGSRPVVAVHLGAHYPAQRWPTDYFARLARLLQDQGCDVVAIGGPGDRELIRCFRANAGEKAIVFESTDLRQSAALISQANVVVCNNSGPLHIAAALGVPTLSFMGPTEKKRWMPLGSPHVVLRLDRLYCIGCNRGTCMRGDHACMRMITPEAALSDLLPMVRQRALRPVADASPPTVPLQAWGRKCGPFERPWITPL